MNKYIRDVQPGDVEYLAANIRTADKDEILATGNDVLGAISESVSLSQLVRVIDYSGKPMAIFGICEFTPDVHAIWAVGTDEIADHGVLFARYSKDTIRELFDITGAQSFGNFTYADNKLHHRWLKWCGASISPFTLPYGPLGKPFFPFAIRRESYV